MYWNSLSLAAMAAESILDHTVVLEHKTEHREACANIHIECEYIICII